MADVRLSWELDEGRLLAGLDRIEDRLNKIEGGLDEVERANRDAFRGGRDNVQQFDSSLRRVQGGIGGAANSLRRLAAVAGAAFGALAIGNQVKDAVNLARSYEQLRVSFTTFLGSAERANVVLEQLNEFSLATPFTPDQVNNAARALLAFGVEADELEPSLKAIGDISAGVGKDFNELANIFGKAKTQGTLFAEDINQLTEAGIPIIQEFADQFGITNDQVKELASEGGITFENLEQAFVSLTSEGGRFFNLMEEQSQTLTGRLSTLQGNFDNLKRELGEALIPVVSDVVAALSDFVTALNSEDVIAFFEPVADDLIPALETLYDVSVDITNALFGFNSEQEQASATTQFLADAFELLVSGISAVVNLLGFAGRAIGDFVEENRILNSVVTGVGDALGFLFDKLQEFFDFINRTAEEDRLQRQLEAQKVKFDEASRAAQDNIAWMEQFAEQTRTAADETDKQAQAQGRANTTNRAARKDLENLRKEYEKLTGTLSSDVEAARLSQLVGIDRLSAERDIAIREINAFADEIRETAAKAGRDLPDSFTEDIQALIGTVEAEFRQGVQELREKEGLSPFEPLKKDLEETDFEALGQDAISRVADGLATGVEQRENILDRISRTIRQSLGLNQEDFEFLQGQVGSIFSNLSQGITAQTEARIAQQDQLIAKIDERIQATEQALNQELALQEEGFANNVDIEKERLETLQAEREKQEQKRLEFEKKAANQRLAIEAAQQASSLATGAARVIAAESNKGLLGIAFAIAAIASIFRIFQQAKSNASQAATVTELREGGLFDGPGLLSHDKQRKSGRLHRIGNSNYAIEKGEWIIGTQPSKEHGAFLSDLNAGKYSGIDLQETVAFASAMYRRGRSVRMGEDARRAADIVRKADGFDRLVGEVRGLKGALSEVQQEIRRRPIVIPAGKAQVITDNGRNREIKTVEVR